MGPLRAVNDEIDLLGKALARPGDDMAWVLIPIRLTPLGYPERHVQRQARCIARIEWLIGYREWLLRPIEDE